MWVRHYSSEVTTGYFNILRDIKMDIGDYVSLLLQKEQEDAQALETVCCG